MNVKKSCNQEDDHNSCPTFITISILSNKWRLGIIYSLSQLENNTLRFKDLGDVISGISQTELTKQLKELESSGIIARKVYAEVPVRVEYSLTKIGVSLLEPINSLYEWAVKYGDKIKENRECNSTDSKN
jgi:DNA-binding HxlR family transcriptional regulator